jgi:hypothetical protein
VAYLVATASATTGAASRNTGARSAAVRAMIQVANASRHSAGASYVARWPRNRADSVTENTRAAHRPIRSLNSSRVRLYSSPVVISSAARLTSRAAASPPAMSAAAPSTGYRTGAPEKQVPGGSRVQQPGGLVGREQRLAGRLRGAAARARPVQRPGRGCHRCGYAAGEHGQQERGHRRGRGLADHASES